MIVVVIPTYKAKNSILKVISKVPDLVDKIIVVASTSALQFERIVKRDGLTHTEIQERMDSQMSLEEKIKMADHTILNEGDLEQLKKEVERVLKLL